MSDILQRVTDMESPSVQTPLHVHLQILTNIRSRFFVLADLQSQLQDLRQDRTRIQRDYDKRIATNSEPSNVVLDDKEELIMQLEDKLSVRTLAINVFNN